LQNGVLTVNEVRRMRGLGPMEAENGKQTVVASRR
jgi:hypothetical protein